MERTDIPSNFTNNSYGGQLWYGRPGSVLTYPGNQSALNQLAMLQGSNQLNNAYQQLISSTQAQQRYQGLAAILSAGAIFDGSYSEMAERSQRIERRINEASKIFNEYQISFWRSGEKIWKCAEDRINKELDSL